MTETVSTRFCRHARLMELEEGGLITNVDSLLAHEEREILMTPVQVPAGTRGQALREQACILLKLIEGIGDNDALQPSDQKVIRLGAVWLTNVAGALAR